MNWRINWGTCKNWKIKCPSIKLCYHPQSHMSYINCMAMIESINIWLYVKVMLDLLLIQKQGLASHIYNFNYIIKCHGSSSSDKYLYYIFFNVHSLYGATLLLCIIICLFYLFIKSSSPCWYTHKSTFFCLQVQNLNLLVSTWINVLINSYHETLLTHTQSVHPFM